MARLKRSGWATRLKSSVCPYGCSFFYFTDPRSVNVYEGAHVPRSTVTSLRAPEWAVLWAARGDRRARWARADGLASIRWAMRGSKSRINNEVVEVRRDVAVSCVNHPTPVFLSHTTHLN